MCILCAAAAGDLPPMSAGRAVTDHRALIAGDDVRWTVGVDKGAPAVVTWRFQEGASLPTLDDMPRSAFFRDAIAEIAPFDAAHRDAYRGFLEVIAAGTGIVFVEVEADDDRSMLDIAWFERTETGPYGWANYPAIGWTGGPVPSQLMMSNIGEYLNIHETLHALGLKHAFEALEANDAVLDPSLSGEGLSRMSAGGGAIPRGEMAPLDRAALVELYGDAAGPAGWTVAVTDARILVDGSERDDVIVAPAGDVRLKGKGGDDHLLGRSGADRLLGGAGDDLLIGGDDVTGRDEGDVLKGNAGDDRLEGGGGDDVLRGGKGRDVLVGGEGDDTLRGDLGNDRLEGGAGRDTLNGGKGRDRLVGGPEANVSAQGDTLNGGRGRDVLIGSGAWDVLAGGQGADRLTGGHGTDTFVFTRADRGALDRILDWTSWDRIDVSALDVDRVSVSRRGDDLLIEAAGVRVRLIDTERSEFDAADDVIY